jgi:hypothetical protein
VGQGAASLRRMRVLQAVFMAIVVLYGYAAESLAPRGVELDAPLFKGIAIAAACAVLLAYFMRRKKLSPALEKLRANSDDSEALKSWRSIILVSLILAEAVALFGLLIRIMGGSRGASWPFFLVALILMVIWGPRLAVDNRGSATKAVQ